MDLVSWSDKLEVEKQTEKTLQSELTLMRSTLANAESELLQAKNKVHTLTSDIEKENQLISQAESDEKDQEFKLEQEVSDLQKQVNATLDHGEQNEGELDQVQKEVKQLETEILERKMQIEKYERDLKECNLEGFMKAPTELVIPALDGKWMGNHWAAVISLFGNVCYEYLDALCCKLPWKKIHDKRISCNFSARDVPGYWNPGLWETKFPLSHIVNTMVADGLVLEEPRTS